MGEQRRVGVGYLEAVTALAQRVRAADPTAGVFEAADFQWWWGRPRPTDVVPQLFWFDDDGRSEAATILTTWGETVGLAPIVMPDADRDWRAHVVERGLVQADAAGFGRVEFVIDRADEVMAAVLAGQGFTKLDDELVDSWLPAVARPEISGLRPDYRLASRLDTQSRTHHMVPRNGPEVEERLRQTSLYRPDLDLVVLDGDNTAAAYGLFWFDPVTATGLVEPMRTEDEHQGRGLARHVLTTGINRLFDAGADRVKIAWEPKNTPAHRLYTSVGFGSPRWCAVVTRPD